MTTTATTTRTNQERSGDQQHAHVLKSAAAAHLHECIDGSHKRSVSFRCRARLGRNDSSERCKNKRKAALDEVPDVFEQFVIVFHSKVVPGEDTVRHLRPAVMAQNQHNTNKQARHGLLKEERHHASLDLPVSTITYTHLFDSRKYLHTSLGMPVSMALSPNTPTPRDFENFPDS